MDNAWVDGAPVSLETAAAAAADLLKKSRLPAITGLGTDVAGARAAILLADRLGGAYDHMRSEILFRDLDVIRQTGTMITTPGETRLRADVIFFVGAKLTSAWPGLMEAISPEAPAKLEPAEFQKRRIVWIGPSRGEAPAGTLEIAATPATIPTILASIRAIALGRKTTQTGATLKKLTEVAEILKSAHFGVAVWSAQAVDSLSIEMLTGLITDLNAATRFSSLQITAPMNAEGIKLTSGWMTGHPFRTGFARGFPEHDTWRFESKRLIDSGEADAAMWISAFAPEAPPWSVQVPLIALTNPGTKFAKEPHVRFEVGTPGVDHAGVRHLPEANTLVAVEASAPSDAVSVATVLGLIDLELNKSDGSASL